MAQHELSGTLTKRRANPRHILLTFKEPVTEELLEEVDHLMKYRASLTIQSAHLQTTETMYDDGFGHLVRTEPKGA